jgi:4-hydroxybenzoate polyprenyltransferase
MIINDIYDITIDKINNSDRPLITGAISIKEAILFSLFILSTSEYLSIKYLPIYLQKIINASIIYITIYTPILKKIPFVKNLSCALLVSSAPFFTGLTMTDQFYNLNKMNNNMDFLLLLCNNIFFGSLTNEILLDIRDYKGDKQNNLKTIPTLLGIPTALEFTNVIIYSNLLFNHIMLTRLMNIKLSIIYNLIMIPQLKYLFDIKKNGYSIESIKKTVNYSNNTLFLLLFYFCGVIKYI